MILFPFKTKRSVSKILFLKYSGAVVMRGGKHATSKKHDIFLSLLDSLKTTNDRVLHKEWQGV